VEFVADADGFFFLEMNTRLQVEHPVTEMITGFDLVEWQLRIAAGEQLPVTQDDVTLNGHAFEARIYAEDPARDFAPSTGRLVQFRLPEAIAGVRVDTGFITGDSVPVHYDPMLAKLIVHAPTRDAALGLLQQSLARCEVVGVASNLDLLHRIATHQAFAAGGIDTDFIARHADTLLAGQGTPPDDVLAAAALGVLADEANAAAALAAASADPFSPWYGSDHWWLNSSPERLLEFHAGDAVFPVRMRREANVWRLTTGERSTSAAGLRDQEGRLRMTLDGMVQHALVTRDGETISVRWNGETFRFLLPDPVAQAETEDVTGGRLVAPLPGQVTEIRAEAGARVTSGQVLVVLEAMKTVFRLTAPVDGVVERLSCTVGETVQEGQVLVGFVEPDEHN
jgi:3-methylcrotonyl-CoA carboxylase alpha subunit